MPQRKDPRSTRAVQIQLGIWSRCDGSARASLGETLVVAGVFGPADPFQREQADAEGLRLDLTLKYAGTLATGASPEEIDLATTLRRTLESCLVRAQMPGMVVSMTVRVLIDDGDVFGAAMLACSGALVSAGVPMMHVPIGVECSIRSNDNEDEEIWIDPSMEESKTGEACRLAFAFVGDEPDPCTMISRRGVIRNMNSFAHCVGIASAAASKLRNVLFQVVTDLVEQDKDLMASFATDKSLPDE